MAHFPCNEVNILMRVIHTASGFVLNDETYLYRRVQVSLFCYGENKNHFRLLCGCRDRKETAAMKIWELFMIAVGLSMDAFAVSVCKGLSMPKMVWKNALLAGIYFGGFQMLMPLIGYCLGTGFQDKITNIDHWIAFVLLGAIGANMIKEALSGEEKEADPSFGVRTMLLLAVATSIDALAVGVTFAFLKVNIAAAVCLIGVTTFCLSIVGVRVGNVFGNKYKSKAELAGGVILILMGLKILLEHLGVL